MKEKTIRYTIIAIANLFNIILHYKLFGKLGILIALLIIAEAWTTWLYINKNKLIIEIKG